MITIINQVKAFKEVKRRNDNYEPLNLKELSREYGFDINGMLQKRIVRNLIKMRGKNQ